MAAAVCWNRKINQTADLKCCTIYHHGFGCRARRAEVIKLLRRRQLRDRPGLINRQCTISCQNTVHFYDIKLLLLLFAGLKMKVFIFYNFACLCLHLASYNTVSLQLGMWIFSTRANKRPVTVYPCEPNQ